VTRVLVHLKHDLDVDAPVVHPGNELFLGDEGAGRADTDMMMDIDDRPLITGTHDANVPPKDKLHVYSYLYR
jgi:hypothetical protein